MSKHGNEVPDIPEKDTKPDNKDGQNICKKDNDPIAKTVTLKSNDSVIEKIITSEDSKCKNITARRKMLNFSKTCNTSKRPINKSNTIENQITEETLGTELTADEANMLFAKTNITLPNKNQGMLYLQLHIVSNVDL